MEIQTAMSMSLSILSDRLFATKMRQATSPEERNRIQKEVKQLEELVQITQAVFQYAVSHGLDSILQSEI
jgi:hypothetical protein